MPSSAAACCTEALNATFISGSPIEHFEHQQPRLVLFMYGGGVQLFVGRKWGSDIGFDGFHVTQPLNALTGWGQNYSRIRIGLFYQTKSAIQNRRLCFDFDGPSSAVGQPGRGVMALGGSADRTDSQG